MKPPEYPMILGIDPSRSSMGLAFPDQSTRCLKPPNKAKLGVLCLAWFRDQLHALLTEGRPQLVVLEDYVVGQKQNPAGTLSTGELGGVIRLMLHDLGIPVALVNPATLRSFLEVGRGDDKTCGISQLSAKTGRFWRTNDEAEAWGLAAMGYCHCGHRWLDLVKKQTDAVGRVEWPALRPR